MIFRVRLALLVSINRRAINRLDRWIFGLPLFFAIGLPLLCWLFAVLLQDYFDTAFLFVPFLFWLELPADIFGRPLFEPGTFGWGPQGIAGWLVTIIFYVTIALTISLLVRRAMLNSLKR